MSRAAGVDLIDDVMRIERAQIGRVAEEIVVKQWLLDRAHIFNLNEATKVLLKQQIQQLRKYGVTHGY